LQYYNKETKIKVLKKRRKGSLTSVSHGCWSHM